MMNHDYDTKPPVNPFVAVKDKPQHLSWKHLRDETEYCFEFIMPMRSLTQVSIKDTVYMIVCVQSVGPQELVIEDLEDGALFVVDFPARTFERAWMATSWRFRQSFGDTDNVQITFRKDTRQSITITKIHKMQPNDDQIKLADMVYNHPEEYAE